MATKPLIVANWKMNPATYGEAKALFGATRKAVERANLSIVVAPPAIFLRDLHASYKGKRISLGAQNCAVEQGGAHTGELSLLQLKDAGASYVIVGHSERRAAGETDEMVHTKTRVVLSMRLSPIICVGERQRDHSGAHFEFVRGQLRTALSGLDEKDLTRVIVAYEPVWAIGKEEATPTSAIHEMTIFIRKTMVAMYGERALALRVLYGGASTEENARSIIEEGDVGGLLVGHVSNDAQRFGALLAAVVGKK